MSVKQTFHLSGVASKSQITRGVPRLRELINVSKNPKTPSLIIHLKKDISKSLEKTKKVLRNLEYTNIKCLIKETSIYYDREIYDKSTIIEKDKPFIKDYYEIFDSIIPLDTLSPWVLRIEFLHQLLLSKDVTMYQMYEIILNKYENKSIHITFTDDNYEHLVMHIRFVYSNSSTDPVIK